MNPNLLYERNHQIILDQIEARKNIIHDEYVEVICYYNVDSHDCDDDDN